MFFTLEETIFYAVVIFALGVVVAFLMLNLFKVDKRTYEKLKLDFGFIKNELEVNKTLVNQLSSDKHSLEDRLFREQTLNQEQENSITSLRVNLKHLSAVPRGERN